MKNMTHDKLSCDITDMVKSPLLIIMSFLCFEKIRHRFLKWLYGTPIYKFYLQLIFWSIWITLFRKSHHVYLLGKHSGMCIINNLIEHQMAMALMGVKPPNGGTCPTCWNISCLDASLFTLHAWAPPFWVYGKHMHII